MTPAEKDAVERLLSAAKRASELLSEISLSRSKYADEAWGAHTQIIVALLAYQYASAKTVGGMQ